MITKREASLKSLVKLKLNKIKDTLTRFVWQLSLGQILFQQVQELDFSDSQIDNKTLEILLQSKPLRALKKLSLKNCLKITSEAISSVAGYLQNIASCEDIDLSCMLINAPNNSFFGDQNIDSFKVTRKTRGLLR